MSLPTADITHGMTHMVAPGPVSNPSTYHKLTYDNPTADKNMLDYLARPKVIAGGTFTTGSSASVESLLFLPSSLTTLFPNLTGALGYRATICYRVEISAAPQASGIVRMAYEICPPNSTSSKASYRAISAQLPGVEVNLRSGTMAELKVPFISDRDYFFLLNSTYTNAAPAHRLVAFPYAPVSWDTTTVSTPSYRIYRWFEDVEVISQACVVTTATPQAGMPESDIGKASTWFKYASKIATYASTIPTLTSIALPVSWAFDAATKIAAHFGWSKPNDGSYMGVMGMSIARGINTCADADTAHPMGYYANNEVGVLPGFAGNDIDEMALCYLTCKPSLIAALKLNATDARDSIKWTCPVTPSAFVMQANTTGFNQLSCMGIGSTATSGNKPGYLPSTIAFCASFFERWRGNIIFRLKFNTTKFHAGKIQIGYVPGEDLSDGVTSGGLKLAPTAGNRHDFHNAIIDLRTTEEYDFVVPFTYPAAWCDTGMALNKSGVFSIPNTGLVFVRTLEPLYGPDNVMQSIDFLVEVLGECGLEFTQPITSIMVPLDSTAAPVVVAQSGRDPDFEAAKYTSGERILSLKQIMMRPMWFLAQTKNIIPQANLCFYNPVTWFPRTGTYDLPLTDSLWGGDTIMSRVSSLFSLQRGGLIVRALPALEDGTANPPTKADWYVLFNWAKDGINSIQSAALSLEWNMCNSISIPYYGKNTRMRTGWSSHQSVASGIVDPNATTRSLWCAANNNLSAKTFLCGVCAGDDFQYGCFTGVPPCVTFEPNVVGVYDTYLRRL